MDFTKSKLYLEFSKLSMNSQKSVQCGRSLSLLDQYLHVERPVEKLLRDKMNEIEHNGSGIILLIGSAGDGKSHLLSRVRQDYQWDESSFYNDATASCSPSKTAVQTLKEVLIDFSDDFIDQTNRKLILAINLGKLNAFIEDEESRQKYSKIIKATSGIFDNDDSISEQENDKIKIVYFANEQIFELITEKQEQYPVQSTFLSSILDKIISPKANNPFYTAYQQDKQSEDFCNSPLIINYELLRMPNIRETIVKTIIEAIFRFKLIITPREFFDFIYSIIICKDLDNYNEKVDQFKVLLPTLIYNGNNNIILSAISKLDPIIYSNSDHDKMLSVLFTSYDIPQDLYKEFLNLHIPEAVIEIINNHYHNNGRELEATTKFVFSLYHLLLYHSESNVYKDFIELLPKVLLNDKEKLLHLYEITGRAIPRHFGSFYEKNNIVPLNIQGSKYKLFTYLNLKPKLVESQFNINHPSNFPLYVTLHWQIDNEIISLKVDYQLYSYLFDLDSGRLVTSFDNEKNLAFNTFVNNLAEYSNHEEMTIVKFNGTERKLQLILGDVRLS